MSVKLIAMGNVLMRDDGIAVLIAGMLEKELLSMGIEVIYGETDPGYCLTQITQEDYLILLDAALLGKQAGDITIFSYQESASAGTGLSQHNICLIDLLRLYFHKTDAVLIAVEAADISYGYGISSVLSRKAEDISKKVLGIIRNIIPPSRG